jgi:hypothetical protein
VEPLRESRADSWHLACSAISKKEPAMTETYVQPSPAAPAAIPISLEEHTRIRWGAVLGGAVAALGIWALLYSFGIAIGLSAVDPDDPGSLRGSGIFTGVWSVIAPIIALFVGGLIASRGADALTKGSGVLHGVVMWGVTTLVGAWAVANLVSAVVGGAVSVGRSAIEGAGGAVEKIAGSLSIDAQDALGPINERLRAEGKAEIQPGELEAATKDVLQRAAQQGRLDRDTLVTSIAENTGLSQADAGEVATRVEQQFERAKAQVGRGAEAAGQKALEAADVTGKAFWGVFGALFLGMLASIAGGAVGASPKLLDRAARARIRAYERVPALREASV